MADRDQPTLARQVQQLAESGDHEGFNAIIGVLVNEFDGAEIDAIKRDGPFRNRITDTYHDAWARKHRRR